MRTFHPSPMNEVIGYISIHYKTEKHSFFLKIYINPFFVPHLEMAKTKFNTYRCEVLTTKDLTPKPFWFLL